MDLSRATSISPELEKAIDDLFEYHPWDQTTTAKGAAIRRALASAVKTIIDCAPPCPDRSAAIRKLREAGTDCHNAIRHDGEY